MHQIRQIGIVGTGVMGAGIARVLASAGYAVNIVKWTEGSALDACARFEQSVMKDVERGKLASEDAVRMLKRLIWSDAQAHDLGRCELVIEAIVEDEEEKAKCYAAIEPALMQSAILATVTSSLSVEALAKMTARPRLFLGLHFFNPPGVMKLVELVTTEVLDPACVLWMRSLLGEIGKETVEVRDAPGFVVNRLMMAQFLEAIRMVFGNDPVADIAGVDACMRSGANHRMGPFELMDFIGLDVVLAMAENILEGFRQQHFSPPIILENMVAAGWKGRKSGIGFYDYADRNQPRPHMHLAVVAHGR